MSLRAQVKHWSQNVYPMGNGRLGFTVFGDPDRERIHFNEDSLWLGNEDYPGGYQPFGDIYVELGHKDYKDYRRVLDIERSLQTVSYTSAGVRYKREYFASYPDQVMVFRFSADQPSSLTGKVSLDSMHRSQFAMDQGHTPEKAAAIQLGAEGQTLTMKGSNKDLFWWRVFIDKANRKGKDGQKQRRGRAYGSDKIIELDYEAQVRVINQGGSVKVEGNHLVFDKCDEVILLLGADTNYINQREKGWRTDHPHDRITAQIDKAAAQSYDALLKSHLEDYTKLYDRFDIELIDGNDDRQKIETAKRLASYQAGGDAGLEALMYRYARYLMISCSRPGHGGLPANLQGLWLFHLRPAWLCDYHTDINLQMNYWFADQANLSGCFLPLAEWVDSIRQVRKEETQKVFGVKHGWLMRSENGVFGGSSYHFQKGDSAWISQNLWDHYAFTQDKEYLRKYAYPVMKEVSRFWLEHLKALPDGSLVVPDGTSPEHGPKKDEKSGKIVIEQGHRTHLDGVSYDQQLCWDLFSNTIEASKALGMDDALRKTLTEKRDRLLGPQIGRWGQLQEWMTDVDDPKNQHRHVSHMLGVYPGRQIHPTTTPEFAQAAKVSMIARGAGKSGWAKVFRACVYGRLLDAERAHGMLGLILKTQVYGNLWATHPPFQIDANFGFAAAVNEMLVQSHMGEIQLLPALPKAWPDGNVRGMRVRGGFELDMIWNNHQLQRVEIRNLSSSDGKCSILYNNTKRELTIGRNKPVVIDQF
ncbi:MAG: glycoside hydrolase family 95 protein [Verrucomicrobiae bacterium]|nr:glycoside hydrolase family 95 protein [Verrucomicrobiae bacterium]NNJ43933.1 glycoside hydrolase family 95 protein [Akkermansiaceae bacterium]